MFKTVLIHIIMDLGQNMMLLRKKKKLSQAALGTIIGTSGDVVGRYERGDITPSIDVVAKIAEVLDVSIDYLVGRSKIFINKEAIERLESISLLAEEHRKFILNMIDMAIRDFHAKRTYLK